MGKPTYAEQCAADYLASWLAFRFQQLAISGVSVAVSRQGCLLFSGVYGQSSQGSKELLTAEHSFLIGSQSKMFTATAILQLIEQEKLQLDDQAVRYLPWLAEHKNSQAKHATIRQLLMHKAGMIRDGLNSDFWQLQATFPDLSQLKKAVLQAGFVTGSYEKLKYSNLGFALLGQIITQVSGQQYEEYVGEHVLTKTKLTGIVPAHVQCAHRAVGYTAPLFGKRLATPRTIQTNSLSPAVGWSASPQDMCRFMEALAVRNGLLLGDTTKKSIQTRQNQHWLPADKRGTGYGLGFQFIQLGFRQLYGHTGHIIGHKTCTFTDPEQQLTVSVMANMADTPIMEILQGILNVLDYFYREAAVPCPANLQKYNNRFMDLWGSLDIVATHSQIIGADPASWTPFEYIEEFELVDDETLRIRKAHDLLHEGELVHTIIRDKKITAIKYGGKTMRPAVLYKSWLANNYLSDELI